MATRQSVENCLHNCEEAIRLAQEQYTEAAKQEHYNDTHYIESQQLLQTAANELEHMAQSSNDQQRAQLNRMKMQIEQLQHEMILLRH
ncbi:MAG: YtzC family protein [Bacillus sp. (in: firmicutes)]